MVDVTDTAAMIAEAARRKQLRDAGAKTFEHGGSGVYREQPLPLHGGAKRRSDVEDIPAPRSANVVDDGVRRITLTWSMLCSDNCQHSPAIWGKPPKQRAVLLLRKEWRQAFERAREHVVPQLGGLPPLEGRLRLVGTIYEPNASRTRDASNFAKFTQDVLNTLAYRDDGQIDDARWIRGAVDIDAPRIEIVVTQLLTVKE